MPFYYKEDFFEKHEKKYDYYSDQDLNVFRDCMPSLRPNSSLLDLACGSGIMAEYFRSLFPDINVFGTDLCLPLLKWASFDKCQSDACFLPFNNNSFDCIVAAAAFHHFPDINKCIKECIRCLKPQGVLLAYEPNKFHLQRFIMMTNPLRHYFYKNGDHAISAIWLKKMLRKENFKNVNLKYVAFKGKGASFLSDLNYNVADKLSKNRLDSFLPFVAPWFIITAVKK